MPYIRAIHQVVSPGEVLPLREPQGEAPQLVSEIWASEIWASEIWLAEVLPAPLRGVERNPRPGGLPTSRRERLRREAAGARRGVISDHPGGRCPPPICVCMERGQGRLRLQRHGISQMQSQRSTL